MKNFSFGGLAVLLLGLLTVLTPYFIFPVCSAAIPTAAGGLVPMKCFWMARSALGSGIIIACAGALLLFIKNPGIRLGLALLPLAAGALVIWAPNGLIGVCPNKMMPCHMGTLPALTLLGALTIIASACIAFSAAKSLRHPEQKTPKNK